MVLSIVALNFPLLCIETDVFELWFWGISCKLFALIAERQQGAWSLTVFIFFFLNQTGKLSSYLSLRSKNKIYFWECIGFQCGHLHVSSHVCSVPPGLSSWATERQGAKFWDGHPTPSLAGIGLGIGIGHRLVCVPLSDTVTPCNYKLCSTREREIKWEGAWGCFCTSVSDFASLS